MVMHFVNLVVLPDALSTNMSTGIVYILFIPLLCCSLMSHVVIQESGGSWRAVEVP